MRSSERGPDVPVQWAAHPVSCISCFCQLFLTIPFAKPLNHYPRCTITSATMEELVVGLVNILSNLFLQYPIAVSNLNGVDKILPTFLQLHEDNAMTKSTLQKTSVLDPGETLSTEIAELCVSENDLKK